MLEVPVVEIIPIKTKLLMPGDDIVEITAEYAPDIRPTDVLCISESPLAITQKRFYFLNEIKPTSLARLLCRFFGQKGSLSTVYGMQTAINEVGAARIVLAFVAGVLGKIIGRNGDFHRIAGKRVSYIDDITGTMPPYDKAIVLSPANAEGVVRAVKKKLGCEAAVVDANDLGGVSLLAKTGGIDGEAVCQALRANPAGNAEEQTPLVVIRNLKGGGGV